MVSSEDAVARAHGAQSARPGLSLRQAESFLGYVMVAPLVVCILLLIIYPLFFAVYISFTDRVVGSEGHFVGLDNYAALVTQPDFQAAVRNTILLVTSIQTIKLIIGL